MIAYIFRRLLSLIPLLLGITFLVFFLMHLAPGDITSNAKLARDIPEEYIEAIEKEYGLDQPFYTQYLLWLKNALSLNLGYSWTYKIPVSELIQPRLFSTFILSLSTLVFVWVLAIPLGVLSALYKDSLWDRITAFLAYSALSVPEFFFAILALYAVAQTGLLPFGGATSFDYELLSPLEKIIDRGYHLILPTLVLGLNGVASIMRVMRANFLETLQADYVRTARAKGLLPTAVQFRHVLRNALNPLISSFGFSLSGLLSGALIVEIILNYPGLGNLMYTALIQEDQFVVLASVLMSGTLLVLGNLVADILLAWSDPRIRIQ